jgi:hypothetical protein
MHREQRPNVTTTTTPGPNGPTTTTVDAEWIVTLDPLDVDTCWRLAAAAAFGDVGRIAFHADDVQQVIPVNYACARRSIVVRTASNSMLHRLGPGADVAFEVDHIEADRQAGWSVLIHGRVWPISPPDDLAPDDGLRLHPWAAGDRDCWIRIIVGEITGRRVHRHRVPGDVLPMMPPD